MKAESQIRKRDVLLAQGDGPRVYTNQQVMEMLGISTTTYSKLIKADDRGRVLLGSSRLYEGGPRVHTQQQWDEYIQYLNTRGVVMRANVKLPESEIAEWKKLRTDKTR